MFYGGSYCQQSAKEGMEKGTRTMKSKANLFRTLLMLPVLLAVLLVASVPALSEEYYDYPLMVPSPQDQETGVLRDTSVRMYFLGPLDPTTVNTDTFKLVKQGTTTPVEATLSYFDWCLQPFGGMYYCAAELDPQADLEAQTTYTATVKGGENGVPAVLRPRTVHPAVAHGGNVEEREPLAASESHHVQALPDAGRVAGCVDDLDG